MYMQKENAAVVTICLRNRYVPFNLRNKLLKLHGGRVSLRTEYIRNTKSALHNAYIAYRACTRTSTVMGHNYCDVAFEDSELPDFFQKIL